MKLKSGKNLSASIRKVTKGTAPRCAVAFWGNGARDALFAKDREGADKARIICDLTMGGTNPSELEALGAPSSRIRQISGLHAKVYISEQGVVIASSNASENGIGFSAKSSRLIEAGIYGKPDSELWKTSSEWFEALWVKAKQVTRDDLKFAKVRWETRRKYAPTPVPQPGKIKKMGLIDNLIERPEIFGDFQFVLTTKRADPDAVRKAKAQLYRSSDDNDDTGLSPAKIDGCEEFTGWSMESSDWPERFVAMHRNEHGTFYRATYRTRGIVIKVMMNSEETDVHFANKSDKNDFPEIAQYIQTMAFSEDDRAIKLFDSLNSGEIFTAQELSKRLRKI